MMPFFPLLLIGVCIACFCFGLFLMLRPRDAIEMQRRFYEKINWRIEPISMSREIRNTRIMGLLLLLFMCGTLICVPGLIRS